MKKLMIVGMLLSMLIATVALADSWLPPSIQHYSSANGQWKLTVYPRGLTSNLGYFEDKVAGKSNAGGIPGDSQKSPIGHMQRRRAGGWQTVWKTPLANDVSPVDALVANDGMYVTFDNWHSVGYGDDAVVFYAADGTQIRKLGLQEFLPKHYIDALPHSVSSIHWRGKPRIDEKQRQVVLPVVVPSTDERDVYSDRERHVDVRFTLAGGSLVPMEGKAWADASAAAFKAYARLKQLREEARHRFVSPLAAPSNDNVRSWHEYLVEAYFRLNAEGDEDYPATKVVPLPSDPEFALLSGYLGEALSDNLHADGVIMVASPSQDVLVAALQKQAKRANAGFLANARVYVAADAAHMPAVRAALAHTSAKVIQLDIEHPIPQRQERLERYLRNFAEAQ